MAYLTINNLPRLPLARMFASTLEEPTMEAKNERPLCNERRQSSNDRFRNPGRNRERCDF